MVRVPRGLDEAGATQDQQVPYPCRERPLVDESRVLDCPGGLLGKSRVCERKAVRGVSHAYLRLQTADHAAAAWR